MPWNETDVSRSPPNCLFVFALYDWQKVVDFFSVVDSRSASTSTSSPSSAASSVPFSSALH